MERVLGHEKDIDSTFLWPFEPDWRTERIVAQQGLFLFANTLGRSFEEVLSSYDLEKDSIVRIKLSSSMRIKSLAKLRTMNINAATLFPGIDGFCRSLQYDVLFPLR